MSEVDTIDIFAHNKAQKAYLADFVRMAGYKVGTDGAQDGVVLLAADADYPRKEGQPVLFIGQAAPSEGVRMMPVPVKAARLAGILHDMIAERSSLPAYIVIGGVTLNTRENIWSRDGADPVRLTEKEVAILLYLHDAEGPVGRDDLLKQVWSYAPDVETHTLETHIYRLRQKIESDPSKPEILLTDGEGYTVWR